MVTEITVSGDLLGVRRAQDFIEEALRTGGCSGGDFFVTRLAAEEALVDAIKHGNQMDPDKQIRVSCSRTAERLDIRVTDEGSGATRTASSPPSAESP